MKANIYAIGFSVLSLGFIAMENVKAQQLLSHVKTESFNNYMHREFHSGSIGIAINEQFYTYNDKNLLVDMSIWVTNNGERYLNSQTLYTYNDDGKSLTTISNQRDYTTKKMNVQSISEYEYNPDGNIASMVQQYRDYNTGEMIYSYKYEYTYGAGETQEFKLYNWNYEMNDWLAEPPYEESMEGAHDGKPGYEYPVNDYEQVYNEDSTLITTTYKSHHQRSGTWYFTSRSVNQVNALGFSIKQATESWNMHCQEWVPSYMSTTKYNDNNVQIQSEYLSWDQIGGEWVLNSRTTSTYIDRKPIADPIEKNANWGLFPNPSDGDVFIELEEGKTIDTRIEVLNKLGQTVFAAKISAGNTDSELDLDFLPNGNYIVRLDDGTDVSSRQVVIQR